MLTPTSDPRPVEQAVVEGIAGAGEPDAFLWIVFRRPDGGERVWYAWTAGGAPLGDAIDRTALATGYDGADWLHIGARHLTKHSRGRVVTSIYPLRPISADVQAGLRAPEGERDAMRRLVTRAVSSQARLPRWLGVGPALLARTDH